jgi:hypothetical protein
MLVPKKEPAPGGAKICPSVRGASNRISPSYNPATLWHFQTGHTLYASPVIYEIDGKQYVTIAAESDIYTCGLLEPQ